ncbi:PREDICTED: E3 ubiquitin-protein ligase RLIM-like [Galeopterus variegatus]|uniref:RING-type E3 ubiquitin transferase n=1 Tax=Galeopterus variegatus TaxID=482537 RepID=A0ABM0PZF9_GALVR|nr:PREDICTED: E3 ubiquitin-protein ligase RLIM-like [Galeopterus variegatus]
MENSDADDEDGESWAQRGNHMNPSVREEDFYLFLNSLNEEDFRLRRDNDLQGTIGENTEADWPRRLQLITEDSPGESDEDRGGGESSDDTSSDDSLIEWIISFEENENGSTGSEQGEDQCWIAVSRSSPEDGDFSFSEGINFHPNNGSLGPGNEYALSPRRPRAENTENRQRQVGNPRSESTNATPATSEQSATEAFIEVPTTRSQRRARSRSPDHRRTRARIESRSPQNSLSEISQRFHHSIPSQTVDQPLVNETERCFTTRQHETLRPQAAGHELQSWHLFEASGASNAFPGELSPDRTRNGESGRQRPRNPMTVFDLEVRREFLQRDRIASRPQSTFEPPNNTVTLESEEEGLRNTSSHSEQGDVRNYVIAVRIPSNRITISAAPQSTLRQSMTVFDESSNLSGSDSDLEPTFSPPSQNMERTESQNGEDGSSGSRSSCSDSNPRPQSSSTSISSSRSRYMSSSSSSPTSSSSSSSEYSEILSLILEDSNEENSPSEARQETTSDEDDTQIFLNLPQFDILIEDDHDQPTGLTKAQIENLAIRTFGENDSLASCCVCITEYTEGTKLRILPCSHEYHVHCIDRWLSENSTCPICRRKVIDSSDSENSS